MGYFFPLHVQVLKATLLCLLHSSKTRSSLSFLCLQMYRLTLRTSRDTVSQRLCDLLSDQFWSEILCSLKPDRWPNHLTIGQSWTPCTPTHTSCFKTHTSPPFWMALTLQPTSRDSLNQNVFDVQCKFFFIFYFTIKKKCVSLSPRGFTNNSRL